jgi:small-conductance mechanosensitive channel
MNIFGFDLHAFFTPDKITLLLRLAVLLFIGFPSVWFVSNLLKQYISSQFNPQHGMVVGKVVRYLGIIIISIMILREMGFELTPLLGAAGIAGVALGFASQTSVSNVISGIFLIAEQPFVVNDIIRVGDVTGQVLSIDTLSVKIRTFENQFVRIPNETILKSQVTTVTRFPIRRADLNISVAYKEDLDRVKEILFDIARKNPRCLDEPEPLLIFERFGSSSIDFRFAIWAETSEWLAVRNEIYHTIKKRFDEEGIEIPFPHVSVYTGSVTKPFPVEVQQQSNGKTDGAA